MSSSITLLITQIDDGYVQKNFEKLRDYFLANGQLDGFKRLEITITQAVTNFKFPHGLGFTPKDLIPTWQTGAGVVTWNYANFDSTNLDITTTGASFLRVLVGSGA